MRNAFLLGGVALFVAGSSFAGGRSRGNEANSLRHSGGAAVTAPHQIAPGLFQAEVNGHLVEARADGSVFKEEVLQEYGSTEAYALAQVTNKLLSYMGRDGVIGYANNMVIRPEAPAAPTVEQQVEARKLEVQWMSKEWPDGTSTLAFADGVVFRGIDTRAPAKPDMLKVLVGDTYLYADGSVFVE